MACPTLSVEANGRYYERVGFTGRARGIEQDTKDTDEFERVHCIHSQLIRRRIVENGTEQTIRE